MQSESPEVTQSMVFGGGCFWCTEAVFSMLRGVISVMPGYAGGAMKNPTYGDVSNGATGHAEVVKVQYNPDAISLSDLLTVFFATHDPTTLNQQGNDVGPQYRSIILYEREADARIVRDFIAELNASSPMGAPIVTEVQPLEAFYDAEPEHRDFYANNPEYGYCQVVINPKLEKVQKNFAELLRERAV